MLEDAMNIIEKYVRADLAERITRLRESGSSEETINRLVAAYTSIYLQILVEELEDRLKVVWN